MVTSRRSRLVTTVLFTCMVVGPLTAVRLATAPRVMPAQLGSPFIAPITAITTAPVALTAPVPNANFVEPASIAVSATVVGTFSQVEFYAGATLLGTTRTAPYTLAWDNVSAGTYTITAVGRNTRGTPTSSAPVQVSVKGSSAFPLVQQSSLRYQGAFKFPIGSTDATSFAYGGSALAYNPARNSLFAVGHDSFQTVAEVSIPEIRNAPTASELARGTYLQTFHDIAEGKRGTVNPGDPNAKNIGGILPYLGRLIFSVYSFYDGSGTQVVSHFSSGMDLSVNGDVQGPFAVSAPRTGYVSGYMGTVPQAWQGALGGPALTGNCCLSIISRTSYGPAVFAFDPADVGLKTPIPASALVYYPTEHPTLWEYGTTAGYSNIKGVVFPEGTRSVLFFGDMGTGKWCYGQGTTNKALEGTPSAPGVPYCYDPEDPLGKGGHAYPYQYEVWAYDATDLAAVKAGRRQPWDVKPYAMWALPLPFSKWSTHLKGAAYDPATGRIFVAQSFADDAQPVIHVFTVALQ